MVGEATLVSLVLRALGEVGLEIRREWIANRAWREAHPCEAATFFQVWANLTPWWSWLGVGRPIRRGRERYWRARCTAHEKANCERLSASATNLVLAYLRDENDITPPRGTRV
jgi:hypothetical protein